MTETWVIHGNLSCITQKFLDLIGHANCNYFNYVNYCLLNSSEFYCNCFKFCTFYLSIFSQTPQISKINRDVESVISS